MLRLQIHTQHAAIGVRTVPPYTRLDIPKEPAKVTTSPVAVEIDIDWPRVRIDARAAMHELGLKSHDKISREYADEGREAALQGVRRRAEEGDALADAHLGVRLAEVAYDAAFPDDKKELNIQVAPKSRPRIEASGGIRFRSQRGEVEVDAPFRPVSVDVAWGAVHVDLRRKAEIHIEAVGDRFSALG